MSVPMHSLHRGSLHAGRYTPVDLVADKCKRVYSSSRQISPGCGKALQFKCNKIQVILHKWKEWFSGSSKGEWTHLIIYNLEVWLGRGHGQMDFYLTQILSGHAAFNAYLFHTKLVERTDCINCDRRICLAHPVKVCGTLTVPAGDDDHSAGDGWGVSYTRQSSPHAEKHWRMGPGGRLCYFDNAPQDGVSAGVTKAANCRRPTSNARP